MYDFTYQRAGSVDDAAAKLKSADDGKLVAGGMTLIPTLKQRLAQPSDLIDLADLKDLVGIKVDGSGVTIGAMTPHATVAASKDVQNAADELFRRLGITFAVYAEGGSTERLIPFDLIPRILDRSEWDYVERGCLGSEAGDENGSTFGCGVRSRRLPWRSLFGATSPNRELSTRPPPVIPSTMEKSGFSSAELGGTSTPT